MTDDPAVIDHSTLSWSENVQAIEEIIAKATGTYFKISGCRSSPVWATQAAIAVCAYFDGVTAERERQP